MSSVPAQDAAGRSTDQPRLLVIGPESLASELRRMRLPLAMVHRSTFMGGIAELAHGPVRSVVARVDEYQDRPAAALAGLRAAANGARIVLSCLPSGEPVARTLLDRGADDYVIEPLAADEVGAALELPARYEPSEAGPVRRHAAGVLGAADRLGALMAELNRTLLELDKPADLLLSRLAEMVRSAIGACSVEIVTTEAVGQAGRRAGHPVLVEPIQPSGAAEPIGEVRVGARDDGPYTSDHLREVHHYASLAGGLLSAAHQQQTWRQMAMTDDLTGLRNRRYLERFVSELLPRAARERFRVTLLIFDIDDFKHYNDEYGHAAGDEILREAGRLFQACCRRNDVVCRYAGDEFAVVFWDAEGPRQPGSQHPSDVLELVGRFRMTLREHEFLRLGKEAKGLITVSGGLATYPWDASSADELIERADAALLAAKRAGKNRILLAGRETEQQA